MSATSISSGLLTASGVVSAYKNYLNGLVAQADGTNVATVIIYDNPSAASGTVIAKVVIPAGSRTQEILFDKAIRADTGLYASISGTGAEATVYFGAD